MKIASEFTLAILSAENLTPATALDEKKFVRYVDELFKPLENSLQCHTLITPLQAIANMNEGKIVGVLAACRGKKPPFFPLLI